MGLLQDSALQRSSNGLLVACAAEEAAVHGSGAVSAAAQPPTAILLVSQPESALLLLDAGGSIVLAISLQGLQPPCALSESTHLLADARCHDTVPGALYLALIDIRMRRGSHCRGKRDD